MNRTYRNGKISLSRSTRHDLLLARIGVIAAILIGVLILLSLGRRADHRELGSITRNFAIFAEKVRRWEVPARLVSDPQKSDLRSNAGFHFDWPARFNPPTASTLATNSSDRLERIQSLLKMGKSKAKVAPVEGIENRFILEETLDREGNVRIRKTVGVVLPGEKIQLSFGANSAVARQWKIRIRAIAVTQDRLDSPLPLLTGFAKESLSQNEIEPRGLHLDLELPSLLEFSKRTDKNFVIEWPNEASGLLILEGFQPGMIDTETRAQLQRTLLVHIDGLQGSLSQLKKTNEILNRPGPGKTARVLLTAAIPPAQDYDLSQHSLLTGRTAVDLGATLRNEKLRSFIKPQQTFLTKTINRGGSTRRIHLETGLNCANAFCSEEKEKSFTRLFTSTLRIARKQEFFSTTQFLRNDEFVTDPGLVFASVQIPADKLRLNWDSLSSSSASSVRWISSGILSGVGFSDRLLQNEEKAQQLDAWLSKLAESFLVTSQTSNIAIILHDNGSPIALAADAGAGKAMTRGEILMVMNDLKMQSDETTPVVQIDTPVSMNSALRFLERMTLSAPTEINTENLSSALMADSEIVSQHTADKILSLTADGWIADPTHTARQEQTRPLFRAEPEKIHALLEKSNSERRKGKLLGLHIFLPPNNAKDELIQSGIETTLSGVACESLSENAHLKSFQTDLTTPANDSKIEILGRRAAQTPWHIFCLFEGRMTNSTQMRLRILVNDKPVARELLGLGEFNLPVRGFLWRSPDTIELLGAQILDATLAVNFPHESATQNSSVLIWSERIPSGLEGARTTFAIEGAPQPQPAASAPPENSGPNERLSEK